MSIYSVLFAGDERDENQLQFLAHCKLTFFLLFFIVFRFAPLHFSPVSRAFKYLNYDNINYWYYWYPATPI